MKKATIIAAAFVVLFAGKTFAAGPETVSAEVKAAFSKTFAKAENVTWKYNGGFYFAQFTINDKAITASYNAKGELNGTSRMITKAELPMIVALELNKAYAGYEISTNINEITLEGETNYYFTATNAKVILNVKADSDGGFTVEYKTKK